MTDSSCATLTPIESVTCVGSKYRVIYTDSCADVKFKADRVKPPKEETEEDFLKEIAGVDHHVIHSLMKSDNLDDLIAENKLIMAKLQTFQNARFRSSSDALISVKEMDLGTFLLLYLNV